MRRVAAALDASPSRIPVLLGGCGSGRTTLLRQLRDRIGPNVAPFIDVERTATTPERFLRAIAGVPAPAGDGPAARAGGARTAFDTTLDFLIRARTGDGEPMTFLLDEFLELRTFESFPGLRRVLHDLVEGLSASGNRFVLTSRYVARSLRLLRDRSARFEVIHMPPLTAEDTLDILGPPAAGHGGHGGRRNPGDAGHPGDDDAHDAEYLARTVQALADGRPLYVRALADELSALRDQGASGKPGGAGTAGSDDPISALASLLAPDGRLARQCGFCYELRLHRARGYGALKAILEILGEEEGLTLTEISQRLQRTPGSTKDYLSWLEDVDLVISRQKRYSFTDPLLRVWVRLHCRAAAPTDDDLAREIHHYALPRLPAPREPALAMAAAGGAAEDDKKPWGIIEID
jgi:hypothetical protein